MPNDETRETPPGVESFDRLGIMPGPNGEPDARPVPGERMVPRYPEPNGGPTLEPQASSSVLQTLEDRGAKYGDYTDVARTIQGLKAVLREDTKFDMMRPFQQEALEMIAHKMGRLAHGDPDHLDSWVDIVGYAQLVVDRLQPIPVLRGVRKSKK